jgi:hypothetical protein
MSQEKEKASEEEKESETEDRDTWSKDQQEKGYYYDDAHGYEIYQSEEEDEEE